MTPKKPTQPYEPPSYNDYTMPPIDLLDEPEHTFASVQEKVVKAKAVRWKGCSMSSIFPPESWPQRRGLW